MAAPLSPVASLRGWLLRNDAGDATDPATHTSRGSGSTDDTASTVALDGDGVGASPWDDWEVVDDIDDGIDDDIPVEMDAGAAAPNPPSVAAAAANADNSNPGDLDGVMHVGPRAAEAKKTRAPCLLELHCRVIFQFSL